MKRIYNMFAFVGMVGLGSLFVQLVVEFKVLNSMIGGSGLDSRIAILSTVLIIWTLSDYFSKELRISMESQNPGLPLLFASFFLALGSSVLFLSLGSPYIMNGLEEPIYQEELMTWVILASILVTAVSGFATGRLRIRHKDT